MFLFLLYFRIRAVLACNVRFLSLSSSFRYRIITSYHHITASLIASESAICKESQWYESRVRVNEFLWILRVNWVVVCTFTACCRVSQCGSSATTLPRIKFLTSYFKLILAFLLLLLRNCYVLEATGTKHAGVHIDHNFLPSIGPIISGGWK